MCRFFSLMSFLRSVPSLLLDVHGCMGNASDGHLTALASRDTSVYISNCCAVDTIATQLIQLTRAS